MSNTDTAIEEFIHRQWDKQLKALDKQYKRRKPTNKERSEYRNEYKRERLKALQRDSHRCSECGSTHLLGVHHIIHRKHGGTNDVNNLITLCNVCHSNKHINEPVYKIMAKNK